MPKSLTQPNNAQNLIQVAGMKSESRPASNRNSGRLHLGIGGRHQSESAPRHRFSPGLLSDSYRSTPPAEAGRYRRSQPDSAWNCGLSYLAIPAPGTVFWSSNRLLKNVSAAAAAPTVALAFKLDRWTRHRSVGAEHAAITCLWPQQSVAAITFVEELTGVHRHLLNLAVATIRAGDLGTKFGLHNPSAELAMETWPETWADAQGCSQVVDFRQKLTPSCFNRNRPAWRSEFSGKKPKSWRSQ